MPVKKKAAKKTPVVRHFVCDEAQATYENVVLKKKLCPEESFLLEPTTTMGYPKLVYSTIHAHNWRTFCQQPNDPLINLVQEFQANFSEDEPETVEVRKVRVLMGTPSYQCILPVRGGRG